LKIRYNLTFLYIGSTVANMQKKIQRRIKDKVLKRLEYNPVVALLGARQVGKSTLAREILEDYPNSVFIDLEKPAQRRQVEKDVELFLQENKGKLICFDEIQLLPEIFSTLRGYIDDAGTNAQFLILGSASRDLLQQSSETLAGRIAYIEITPFDLLEICDEGYSSREHWFKGGYPNSLLQSDLEESTEWREDYIRTFLERDLPQLGFNIPATTLDRFWRMLAHCHGQLANYSTLGKSLDVTHHTIKSYIDILEETFVVRSLRPFFTNEGKRLVKSPKIYIRDSGLLHSLLNIDDFNSLLGHPVVGNSFESYVIENIVNIFPRWDAYFYRDSTGNEVDLVLEKGLRKIAIEIKSSTAPKIEKGFWNSVKFLKPDEMWCIAQVDTKYPGGDGLWITNLELFLKEKLNEM
jgi:predicted AAA+ superfamily ATPase